MMHKLIVTMCLLISVPIFMFNVWAGIAFIGVCWVWAD